ncbi:MAG TPA: hypothetical protein VF414_19010 [Thermoanaerobaculia bacterium]
MATLPSPTDDERSHFNTYKEAAMSFDDFTNGGNAWKVTIAGVDETKDHLITIGGISTAVTITCGSLGSARPYPDHTYDSKTDKIKYGALAEISYSSGSPKKITYNLLVDGEVTGSWTAEDNGKGGGEEG